MIDKFGYNISLKNKIVMFSATWNISYQIKYHALEKMIVQEKFAQFSKYLFLFLDLKDHNHAKTLSSKL